MTNSILNNKSVRLFLILSAVFIACVLLAEVIGVKIFSLEASFGLKPLQIPLFGQILSLNLTAGVLLWPVVFIMTDIINEYYGKKFVRFLSYLTAIIVAFAFIIFIAAIKLHPADFFIACKQGSGVPNMELAFESIFGQGANIILGSLMAFIFSQLLDVFIFHRIKKFTGENSVWLRATGSTAISQGIDSFVVLFIAFYVGSRINAQEGDFVWPFRLVLAVGLVNYIYKILVAVVLTPVIYIVHYLIEQYLGKDLASEMKTNAMLH